MKSLKINCKANGLYIGCVWAKYINTNVLFYYIDKGFKGTVVNRTLPFLQKESLEISLTVPLNRKLIYLKEQTRSTSRVENGEFNSSSSKTTPLMGSVPRYIRL